MSLTATVVEVSRSQALKTEPYPPFGKLRIEQIKIELNGIAMGSIA